MILLKNLDSKEQVSTLYKISLKENGLRFIFSNIAGIIQILLWNENLVK